MSPNQSKRRVLDIKTKKDIIELSKSGYSHQKIAESFNIGRSTVTKILLRKDVILNNTIGEYDDNRKRIRINQFDIIEKRVIEWYNDFNSEKSNDSIQIQPHDIIYKANQIAKELDIGNFEATHTWLLKFRKRFQLGFKVTKKEVPSEVDYSPTNIVSSNIVYNPFVYTANSNSISPIQNPSSFNNELFPLDLNSSNYYIPNFPPLNSNNFSYFSINWGAGPDHPFLPLDNCNPESPSIHSLDVFNCISSPSIPEYNQFPQTTSELTSFLELGLYNNYN